MIKRLFSALSLLVASSTEAASEDLTIYSLVKTIVASETRQALVAELPRYGYAEVQHEAGNLMFSSADVGGNITFIDEPALAYAIFLESDAATARQHAEQVAANLLPGAIQTIDTASGATWADRATEPNIQVFWTLQGESRLPTLGIVKKFNRE